MFVFSPCETYWPKTVTCTYFYINTTANRPAMHPYTYIHRHVFTHQYSIDNFIISLWLAIKTTYDQPVSNTLRSSVCVSNVYYVTRWGEWTICEMCAHNVCKVPNTCKGPVTPTWRSPTTSAIVRYLNFFLKACNMTRWIADQMCKFL